MYTWKHIVSRIVDAAISGDYLYNERPFHVQFQLSSTWILEA